MEYPGYRPPTLMLNMARLCGALASRAALAAENAAFPLSFHFEPSAVPLAEQAALTFEVGGFLWQMEFYSLDFLAANPALAGTDPRRLPEPLRRAALLLFLQAFLERLEKALEVPVNPYDGEDRTRKPPGWLEPVLRFTLDFAGEAPEKDSAHGQVPIGLRVSSREGADWLCTQVRKTLSETRKYPWRTNLRLEVRLEAGAMRVPSSLLQNLAVADILIPPDYPAKDGRLALLLPGGSGFAWRLPTGAPPSPIFITNRLRLEASPSRGIIQHGENVTPHQSRRPVTGLD